MYVCVWLWVYRNSSSPGSVAERPIYQGAISGTERREFREWGIKSQIAIKKKRKRPICLMATLYCCPPKSIIGQGGLRLEAEGKKMGAAAAPGS